MKKAKFLFLFLFSTHLAFGALPNWPQFRGPTGQGHAVAQQVPLRWSDSQNVAWRTELAGTAWSSPILSSGKLYLTNAVPKGEDFSLRTLCLDATTGEEKWKTRGYGKGSLIIADGHLIILGEIGNLSIAEATPDAIRAKATRPVFASKCWTNPSLADGRIYLRDDKEIVCLNINQ